MPIHFSKAKMCVHYIDLCCLCYPQYTDMRCVCYPIPSKYCLSENSNFGRRLGKCWKISQSLIIKAF